MKAKETVRDISVILHDTVDVSSQQEEVKAKLEADMLVLKDALMAMKRAVEDAVNEKIAEDMKENYDG